MERCLDFAPFAVARFCVPLSFAEPSLCCNVAIALSAARRPRCEQGAKEVEVAVEKSVLKPIRIPARMATRP